jgi:formylglycine-generating enzyme required for sulfatase activity
MVGNVWEWVDGQVTEGVYDGRTLPQSGYVTLVDTNGVVAETANKASAEFGEDYALTDSKGLRGMIRGGFYKSGNDAGIFAQNLSVPLDFKATGVGFRCVKDV